MTIAERIGTLEKKIAQLAVRYQRNPCAIHLLAVSKGQSACSITQAFTAGLSHFGESYVQEALPKIKALENLPLTWHFIGAIQSNKARAIAQHFSWVHSVNSLTIAQKLNAERQDSQLPLNICIQINIDNEASKSGIPAHLAAAFTKSILDLPKLRLRGLMVIPKPQKNDKQQYHTFLQVAYLLEELNSQYHLNLDTLSMGMSDDFAPAIEAGSTFIRIGRAIFGERIQHEH